MCRTLARCAVVFALAVLVLGASGCGPRKFNVTGKVTYNGAAIDNYVGQIVFRNPNGEQVIANINPDGTYQASGVFEGANKIAVDYKNPKAQKARKPRGETPRLGSSPILLPEKYANPNTSEKSITVDKDMVFDWDLTGPPIK